MKSPFPSDHFPGGSRLGIIQGNRMNSAISRQPIFRQPFEVARPLENEPRFSLDSPLKKWKCERHSQRFEGKYERIYVVNLLKVVFLTSSLWLSTRKNYLTPWRISPLYVWSSHIARVRINRERLPILLVVS